MADKVAEIAFTGWHHRAQITREPAIQAQVRDSIVVDFLSGIHGLRCVCAHWQLTLKKIHGVGLASARELYYAGFTTIEKLREGITARRLNWYSCGGCWTLMWWIAEVKRRKANNEEPLLTRQQNIGLDCFEDLQKRIPRKVQVPITYFSTFPLILCVVCLTV